MTVAVQQCLSASQRIADSSEDCCFCAWVMSLAEASNSEVERLQLWGSYA